MPRSHFARFQRECESLRGSRRTDRPVEFGFATLPHAREECGADSPHDHDDDADDVIAFPEDAVDAPEDDRQHHGDDAECGDVSRSRSESGDERSEDQCTDEGRVLRDRVGDDDQRRRQQSCRNPPPRPRNGARRARQHACRLVVGSRSIVCAGVRLKIAPCRYDLRVASIDLPPERSAAAQARRFVREVCASWDLVQEVIDDIELLVSELVTNAVLHARSAARLTIERFGDCIRVTVADSSAAPPRLRDYGPEAATGRGVLLVDRLARGWGVDPADGAGKRVWFEVAVEPASEGSRA